MVTDFAAKIDVENTAQILQYGAAAQKKMAGAMKLTNVCEAVMEVFEITGFADILVIE